MQAVTIPPRIHHQQQQQQQQQQQEQQQQPDNEPIDVTFDSAAGLPSLNEMQNMQPRTSAHGDGGEGLIAPSPEGAQKHRVCLNYWRVTSCKVQK